MRPTIIGLNDCSFLDAEETEMQNHLDHVEWTQSFDTNCLSGWVCRDCKLVRCELDSYGLGHLSSSLQRMF